MCFDIPKKAPDPVRSVRIAGEKVIIDDFLSDGEFGDFSDEDDFVDDDVDIQDATKGANPNQQIHTSNLKRRNSLGKSVLDSVRLRGVRWGPG